MAARHDLSGLHFGKLTILYETDSDNHRTYWLCKCECGKQKIIWASNLVNGHTKSCGCLKNIGWNKKHGHALNGKSKTYNSWASMIQRCTNKNNAEYKHYGARGILVCSRWLNSFEDFLQDMGKHPGHNLSLGRINNEGNYEPGNVEWQTNHQQSRNKRSNVYLNLNGKALCISDWSKETGIGKTNIRQRLIRGWDVEKTLTTPVREGNYRRKSHFA